MKKILTLVLFVLISLVISYGQVPQAFKYQAIAHDNQGSPLVNRDIGIRISLLHGSDNGRAVYCEVQHVTSNEYGLIDLEIGKGRVLTGVFTDIDWGNAPYYLKIEMDDTGGTDYRLMGSSELLSVPYALYAGQLDNKGSRAGEWTNDGTNIYVAPSFSTNNVGIGTSAPSDKLHIYGGSSAANLIIESNITGSNGPISRFRLKNSADGDIFNLSLRRNSGNTEMLQSVYDASATTWREYVYFNVNTQKYEIRSGIGLIEYKNSGHVLFSNTGNVGIAYATPRQKLEVNGKIRADAGFNMNGDDGTNDTVNQVTAFDFANNKLKYRTLIIKGGITTYVSPESEWLDAVGDPVLPFVTCGDPLYDRRDGRSYPTVLIGTQCWMARNLNIGIKKDWPLNQTDNDTIEKYCYDNNLANCEVYGELYQLAEANDYNTINGGQGICPDGWHLSTDDEWCTLATFLDGTVNCTVDWAWTGTDAGGKLKETGTTHWSSPNSGATNSSGFQPLELVSGVIT